MADRNIEAQDTSQRMRSQESARPNAAHARAAKDAPLQQQTVGHKQLPLVLGLLRRVLGKSKIGLMALGPDGDY